MQTNKITLSLCDIIIVNSNIVQEFVKVTIKEKNADCIINHSAHVEFLFLINIFYIIILYTGFRLH